MRGGAVERGRVIMPVNADVLALLRSIDDSLRLLAKREPATPQRGVDLDGPYGNPQVRQKDPRDWHGDPMKGRRFSACPPEYLDLIAERFDYFASREEDLKKQKYALLDAQRARGWAARLRSGWSAPAEPPAPSEW
jgi:hypothetical protein